MFPAPVQFQLLLRIKNGGKKEKLDEILSNYYDIFTKSYLPKHDYISYKGKKVEPKTVLHELEEKLGVPLSKCEKFRKGIQTFMDQSNPKRIPGYGDILTMDSSFVVATLEEIDYLPWMKIMKKEGMTQLEQNRINSVQDVFVNSMGYCEHCAADALVVVAQNYNSAKKAKVKVRKKKKKEPEYDAKLMAT